MFSANTSQVSGDRLYVEDVFSTYLYTGNGSKQTINNGIELGSAFASGGYITLDGTNYLKSPTSSAFAFGTGDFTMEAWIYPTSVSGTTGVVSTRVDGSASSAQVFFGVAGGAVLYYAGVAISGGTVLANNWYHVACTRSGTTVRIFLDGVQVGSGTDTADKTTTFGFVGAGAGDTDLAQVFKGRISNARFVKGTALYTSNFTPSTTPLTAVSGTSLLTCQSPNLTADNSANAFTLTQVGTVQTTTSGGPFADATKGKGGLVWMKSRSTAGDHHVLTDTVTGATKQLASNLTDQQYTYSGFGLTSFGSTGFTLTDNSTGSYYVNGSSKTYASWTFRKAPKFFDVVTYTGNGTNPRSINHALGTTPGFIVIKNTGSTSNWFVLHRGDGSYVQGLCLNDTRAGSSGVGSGFGTPTSTQFVVSSADTNASGNTYVAYLFAHDTTSDGIIQCGSYTGNGVAGREINLGWEPQWVLLKNASDGTLNWFLWDNMRGFPDGRALFPNTSGAESSGDNGLDVTSTGLVLRTGGSKYNASGSTYIYIAIRRGPMRTPTSGTSVFAPVTRTGTGATATITSPGFPPDLVTFQNRAGSVISSWTDKMRGPLNLLFPALTLAEQNAPGSLTSFNMDGVTLGADNDPSWGFTVNASGEPYINYFFRRAPSFFDEVCYTGTGAARTINHNLGVAPELMIIKSRSSGGSSQYNWMVYSAAIWGTGVAGYPGYDLAVLNTTAPAYYDNTLLLNNTQPTSSVFSLGTATEVNSSGVTYVAYLFASCPGVSKCGSYTGNGSSQTINCGFAAGARFVMIKRADNTGDWYVWDTARGIVSGNDPHLSLNSTAAEVTTDDSVDTDSSGFVVNQLSATNINVSSATYIYLAVA